MDTMERVSKSLEEAHEELKAIIERQREQQAVDEEISKARTTLEECLKELKHDGERSEKTAASLGRATEALAQGVRILSDAQLGKLREDIPKKYENLTREVRRARRVAWICTACSLGCLAGVGGVLYHMMNQ